MESRPKVVILGGGMGGLAAAWELSQGAWRERLDSITVFQRGWRLGGKGASSRGPNDRIEEHGLHVLLGYYHDTFAVMRDCYAELDRPCTRPDSPIRTWDEAVAPTGLVGLVDRGVDGWRPWVTEFSSRPDSPGDAGPDEGPLGLVDVVRRSLQLLLDFHRAAGRSQVVLSASPEPPSAAPDPDDVGVMLRTAGLTALAAAFELVDQAEEAAGTFAVRSHLAATLQDSLRRMKVTWQRSLGEGPQARRTFLLVDLVFTNLRGMVVDRLLTRPEGLAAINHLDYRDWLRRHGASAETVDQAIVRGMYDLVFAYEDGDPARPRFSAGLGLELATRMLLGYRGALFWKMRAGMGEIIFAPLYEALRARGVEFRFFHRVENVSVGADGTSIADIRLRRQVDLVEGPGSYDPLVEVDGLPCWPSAPEPGQLVGGAEVEVNLESHWAEWDDAGSVELAAGRDFDEVVFAISLGMVPHVASELMDASARWREMVANVATVSTQALQLWLTETERAMGWPGPEGVTLSGFAEPFDTWASMGHLVPREGWPAADRPESIAYFCNVLAADVANRNDAQAADDKVRANALQFLRNDLPSLWSRATNPEGDFRWDVLAGAGDAEGVARLDTQYLRANVDPSDRYVQSLPGTDRYRLSPGDTGFRNLTVAGDWTDCGLNAGCVEAATRSGKQAAQAVLERISRGRRGAEEAQ